MCTYSEDSPNLSWHDVVSREAVGEYKVLLHKAKVPTVVHCCPQIKRYLQPGRAREARNAGV